MPIIMDYPTVLERLTKRGFRSLYFNSGAFGFPSTVATQSRGWIGPPDSSIRESVRPMVRQAPSPHHVALSRALIEVWKQRLPGRVWLMPKSHWAYELEFGHRDWLPGLLKTVDVDAKQLASLNNAAALEFRTGEEQKLKFFSRELLVRLVSSDFQLVFPERSTVCTIHTRCQLWWTTTDAALIEQLDLLLPEAAEPDA